MKNKNAISLTRTDKIFQISTRIFLAVLLVITLYPVLFVVLASVSDPTYVNSGALLLFPRGFHLTGYQFVIRDDRILTGYINTLIYAGGSVFMGLLFSLPAGYALSRKDLGGRGFIMAFMVFTMFFSGGLIPAFINVRNLGLFDTRAIIIILGSVSVWNIILIRTFFQSSIPDSLHDAAQIDGCGDAKFFTQIVLPLSKAIVAVIALFIAVGQWNSFFTPLIFLQNRDLLPLQNILRQIILVAAAVNVAEEGAIAGDMGLDQAIFNQVIRYAVIVVSTIPIICLYPFLQKYFVQGVMIGSLKE